MVTNKALIALLLTCLLPCSQVQVHASAEHSLISDRHLLPGFEDDSDTGPFVEGDELQLKPFEHTTSATIDHSHTERHSGEPKEIITPPPPQPQPEENATIDSEGELTTEQAREYMVELINRDRRSQGLSPVTLDETASKAGQSHAEEMAIDGYLSHWSRQGKKPDQRYTEFGGTGYVMENAHLHFTGSPSARRGNLPLAKTPHFWKADIERVEFDFFNERPPQDGHRKNILNPRHNRVGIGLGLASKDGDQRMACTQEFVNTYSLMKPVPSTLKLGKPLLIEGRLDQNLRLYGIDLMFEEAPKPMSIDELNSTYSYAPPSKRIAAYWPNGYRSPEPITIQFTAEGEEFSLSIPTGQPAFRPGLYYVIVWAKHEQDSEPFVVSQRALLMDN